MTDTGLFTTVHNSQVTTSSAEGYIPQAVSLDEVIAERADTLGRDTRQKPNAFKWFLIKLGRKIKRYFTYNVEGRNPRAWELDVLRGIILLLVTLDHCLFYGRKEALMPTYTAVGAWLKDLAVFCVNSDVRRAVQPFALWLIALMSGINCSFTRSKFHRVFKFWILCALFMGGYALLHIIWSDLVTGQLIFNIIAVLTICFTVWWILDLVKCPYWVRAYLGAALIVLGLTYYYKYFVLDNAYVENSFLSLMVYNEHGRLLSEQNFEPLLPHLGFFLVGGVLGKFLYPDRKTKCRKVYPPKALTPVLLVGKHSLAAYLVLPFLILGIARGVVALIGLFV